MRILVAICSCFSSRRIHAIAIQPLNDQFPIREAELIFSAKLPSNRLEKLPRKVQEELEGFDIDLYFQVYDVRGKKHLPITHSNIFGPVGVVQDEIGLIVGNWLGMQSFFMTSDVSIQKKIVQFAILIAKDDEQTSILLKGVERGDLPSILKYLDDYQFIIAEHLGRLTNGP